MKNGGSFNSYFDITRGYTEMFTNHVFGGYVLLSIFIDQ